jgi:hypothetical protein
LQAELSWLDEVEERIQQIKKRFAQWSKKMYLTFLTLHNITRWFVIVFAVLALVRAFSGWSGKKPWVKADDRASMLFTSFLDLQLLLGLVLYIFLSPFPKAAFTDFGAAMGNAATRFYAVEHVSMMLVAVVLAHVGRAVAKKAPDALAKFRRTATWFTLSIVVVLLMIPWPFMPDYGRPLLRLFGITV